MKFIYNILSKVQEELSRVAGIAYTDNKQKIVNEYGLRLHLPRRAHSHQLPDPSCRF